MLSMLKFMMLFRYICLQQDTCIARAWRAEQLSLGTASAEHPGEVDVTMAQPVGNGHSRERSLVPFAETTQNRSSSVCDASVCKRTYNEPAA